MRERHNPIAQPRIERHALSAPRLPVEQSTFQNRHTIHFLKAERLRRQLHPIPILDFGATDLVFDRFDDSGVAAIAKLDDVGNPVDSKLSTHNANTPLRTDSARTRVPTRINALMKELAAHGVRTLLPHLLNVDQRPLPLAKREVLQP